MRRASLTPALRLTAIAAAAFAGLTVPGLVRRALAQDGCGYNTCKLQTYTQWGPICCTDAFSGCRRYQRRQGECTTEGFGYEFKLLATYTGTCNEATHTCSGPEQ